MLPNICKNVLFCAAPPSCKKRWHLQGNLQCLQIFPQCSQKFLQCLRKNAHQDKVIGKVV